jgi:hypothetical protein
MRYDHKNKEVRERFHRIDIAEYVRTFLLELARLEKKPFIKLNSLSAMDRVKGLLNIPENTTFKSLSDIRTGFPYWEEQQVDCIGSNLGRGYIFYFICNGCGRRSKYLYEYSMTLSPLCRVCCRITYRRKSNTLYIPTFDFNFTNSL